jgi:hypothetical protein
MHHFIGRVPPPPQPHFISSPPPSPPPPPAPHLSHHSTLTSARAPPQPLIWIKSGSCHPRGKQEILYSSVIIAGARTTHTHSLEKGKGKLTGQKGTTATVLQPTSWGSARTTAWLRVRIDVVFSCQEVQRCPMVVYHQCCRCRAPARGFSLTSLTHSLTHSRSLGYGRSTGRQMRKRGSKWDCS